MLSEEGPIMMSYIPPSELHLRLQSLLRGWPGLSNRLSTRFDKQSHPSYELVLVFGSFSI